MTNEEKAKKRKGWVKNVAIVFLALMLVLTFFSNTIMNRSLPVVSAQYANSGTISAKIRGNGTVSSNENYNVTVSETREVKSVGVKVGDTVTAGQTLFILADKESDELQTAKDNLNQLNYDYETFLLDMSASDPTVKAAQQTLARAQKDRDKAYTEHYDSNASLKTAKAAVDAAQTAYDKVKDTLATANKKLLDAKNVADAAELALTKATNALTELEGKLTTEQEALKADLNEAQKALDNAKLELDSATAEKTYVEEELGMTYDEAKTQLNDAITKMGTLEDSIYTNKGTLRTNAESIRSSYTIAGDLIDNGVVDKDGNQISTISATEKSVLRTFISELKNLETYCWDVINNSPPISSGTIDAAYSGVKVVNDELSGITYDMNSYSNDTADCLTGISTLMDSITVSLNTISSMNSDYYDIYVSYNKAQAVLNSRDLSNATSDFDDATELVKDCQQKVNEETIKYNNSIPNTTPETDSAKKAVTEATNKKTQADYDMNTAQKYYDQINAQLTEKQTTLDDAKTKLTDINTADDTLTAADNAVIDAQQALSSAVETADIANEKDKLTMEQKKQAITDAEAKIDKLTADAAPQEIVSKYDGTVTTVNVAAGDKTDMNTPLAEIQLSGKGFTMTMSVSTEQAKKVSVGDKAELTNYWYNNYSVQLVSITPDRDSKGQNKILTFSVEGDDIVPGQSLSISIGQKSENYDTLVPNSAVREDSKGKFVFVVQVKSSPLGNRYICKRMDVSVLASDDTYSAVSGLDPSEFVIVSSTAPLEASMQVRMSEE